MSDAMKLNLSDEPQTVELLAEALKKTGAAVISVNGNSMYPTLQMGWRVHLQPATGGDLKIGMFGVFRGERYLTVHRLVWRERGPEGERLVFRGDYNRLRERVPPEAVIARVVAIQIPGRRPGTERTLVVQPDLLTWFYRVVYGTAVIFRPLLPRPKSASDRPGPLGTVLRGVFAATERVISLLLRDRR